MTKHTKNKMPFGQEQKILILGAGGNLGHELARVLGNRYRLLLWDRQEADILDFENLNEKIREHRPGIIINCVAYNAVDKCEEDEGYAAADKLNYQAVENLAKVSRETGAILVQYISDYIFDGGNSRGYSEDDKPDPVSRYGKTKLRGERAVVKEGEQGLKYYIIRTSKLFGPQGPSQATKESFFDLIRRLYQEGRKEFNMVHGEEIACFTYTPDLAVATRDLIEDREDYGIYHLVNEGPASWYEGAKEMFKLLKAKDVKLNPVASADYPRPAKRPRCSVLQNNKRPKLRPWQQALKEYLQSQNA